MIQSDDAPRHIVWTTEEEIALAKGWVAVSKNNKYGNARKEHGFWCEVLEYVESKTKQYGRPTYDMVCGEWKTVRPAVIWFCGVYGNVMRMSPESGASDEDYINRAMIHYQVETGNTFKYRHCREVLKDSLKWKEQELKIFATESEGGSKRHKSSGSSSFNIESGDASINLNTNAGDNDEDEVQEIRRLEGRDKARAAGKNKGLMVTEMTTQEKEECLAFIEIKMREVECRKREVAAQEYRARQEDIRFYLQSYDHLTGDQRMAMDEAMAAIKAKYNLQY
ncbi:putative reverse transcriptase domain-containing protein [Tanacetum coccineum]